MPSRGAKNKSSGGGIGGSGGHRLRIMHLDKTTIEYKFDKSTLGKDCMLYAAEELRIKEHSYFSLKFKSLRGKTRWVHANKPIKKQLEKYSLDGLGDPTLFLEVKFYPTHVHMVGDEVTRYLFYLQLKMDILDGRLECSALDAIKLAAYSVQSEFGDFDPDRHSTVNLREMNLLPEKHCNIGLLDSMLDQITELHQKFHGVSASVAEQNYLNITQSLSEYGQEGFEVLDDSYNKLSIGACAMGIFVKNFIGEPPLYMKWDDLKNMTYTDKYFGVESIKNETILFNTTNVDSAKYIWWCLSEQNMFFLKQSQQLQSGHHYCSRPSSRRSGMTSYASEEILSSEGANGRSTASPSLPYPLQHAVSTSCFATGPRSSTDSATSGLSRYHSDIDVNSQAVGNKHQMNFSPRTTFSSPSRCVELTPSHLSETMHAANHVDTLPINSSDCIPGYKEKISKYSTVPKLMGFRKISHVEMLPENNSLPNSQRNSGSFSSSVPISPFGDTYDSGSMGQQHSPSPFNVIYEGEVATHRGLLNKRDSSVKNKYMEQSGSSQIHSQLSKTNSVPGVDLNENPTLVVTKLYNTVIPRKYSKSEDDIEDTHNNTDVRQVKTGDKFESSERFVPLPDHKISLPRRSASLAQRSITDDPVKYYKFLASLFKRKYESWCTDEFSNIKAEILSTSHSKKPENINKNRYRDVLPFNSTRVKLDGNNNTESSDYINASHILYIIKDHNYHFIAAQSPMGHTCTNFWQMVWEQDVRIIAMLESTNKEDTPPSHVYFPASSDPTIDDYIQFDQYKISIRSYQDKGAFLFRQFKVKHIPTGQIKKVFHLQFLDWIEQDSPKSYEGFQAYIDYIRGVFSKETGPLLIHCNSGTGPTGVFILLYLLQEHIKLQEILHVQNALVIIRRQRMNMVATPAQFKFVYFSMYKYTQYLLAMEDRHTLI